MWFSIPIFKNFPQFVVIDIVKGFGVVNKAEADVFLEFSCFFDDPEVVGNLISGSSTFSKTSLNIRKLNDIKNTLEGTNSRIMEAEDRISKVEDRMVEIHETERKKELKEMRTNPETSGTISNAPTFESLESQKKTKRKTMREYLRR